MKSLFERWKRNFLTLVSANSLSLRFQWVFLGLILLSCLAVRLWMIDVPSLDRTFWKEIDYITISSNYWKHGYKFLEPEVSWPAEPPHITAMELPLVPYGASLLYGIFGFNALAVRAIPLFSWLLMSLYVYRLGKRELGAVVGLSAALSSAIMPLFHQFRNILFSEPLVLACSVMALFHFAEWVDHRKKQDWILATVTFSLAVSLKLEPLYLLLPLLWIAFRKYGFRSSDYRSFIFIIAVALILPVVWYSYAYYLGRHSIDVFGIFGGHDKMQTFTMLSDPTWYRRMAARIRWDILGGNIGTLLSLGGVIVSCIILKGGLFFFYLVAIGCFFAIVAEGQIDAPYRQLMIIPSLSLFMGMGAVTIPAAVSTACSLTKKSIKRLGGDPKRAVFVCMVPFLALSLGNYGKIYRESPMNLSPLQELAKEITKHAADGGKLIAAGEYTIHKGGYDLSPVLYYYSGLKGWTLQPPDWNSRRVHELIQKGATLFAATRMSREPKSLPFIEEMKSRFRLLYENKDRELLLLDLRQPLSAKPEQPSK